MTGYTIEVNNRTDHASIFYVDEVGLEIPDVSSTVCEDMVGGQ